MVRKVFVPWGRIRRVFRVLTERDSLARKARALDWLEQQRGDVVITWSEQGCQITMWPNFVYRERLLDVIEVARKMENANGRNRESEINHTA